jgi:hypothetical protein
MVGVAPLNAQSLFTLDTPQELTGINLLGEIGAFGDVNNDGYTDLVIGAGQREPIILFYDSNLNRFKSPDTLKNTLDKNQSLYITPMYHKDSLNHVLYVDNSNAFFFNPNDSSYTTIDLPSNLNTNAASNLNFGDFDQDGTLDYVRNRRRGGFPVNTPFSNIFNLNDETSSSYDTDLSNAYQKTNSAYTYDFTNDGTIDYFVINDGGTSDRYYISDNQLFSEVGASYLREDSYSYGAAVGDVDNDGDLDIYRTTADNQTSLQNGFFRNDGHGNFTKEPLGITTLDRLDSRNAVFGDYDNDGDLDLLVAEYSSPTTGNSKSACSLYENLGNGEFDKKSLEPVMNQVGNWIQAFFFDRDRDGDLDILTFGDDPEKPTQWYTNNGSGNNWLALSLKQSNAFYSAAYGTKVKLEATIDGKQVLQYREYNSYSGYLRQLPPLVHFGLGDATSATLTIIWPSGQEQVIDLTQDDLNQYQNYTEPLAGKLARNAINGGLNLEAKIKDESSDSTRFQNVGQAAITVDSIKTSAPYLTVISFDTSLGIQENGWVKVSFQPDNITQVGSHKDTLEIYSDAINSPFLVPVSSFARTEAPPFKKLVEAEISLTNVSDSYEYSAFFDADADTAFDAMLFIRDKSNQFFEALQDTTYQSVDVLTGQEITYATSSAIADYNNDGRLDVFITNPSEVNHLYRNDGQLRFSSMSLSGLNERVKNSTSASFYDFNKDDWPDLFVTNGTGQKDELLINDHGNGFELWDAGDLSTASLPSSDHTIVDLNADSLADIIVTTAETGVPSYLRVFIQGENQKFTNADIPNLTDFNINTTHVLPWDFDNDEDFDLIITTDDPAEPLLLFRNDGDLRFERVHNETLNSYEGAPTDLALIDYNFDGYTDLFITDEQFNNPNVLFESIDGEDFLRITSGDIATEDEMASYGVAITDRNRDARPDLLVTNFFNQNRFYETTLDTLHWLAIQPLNEYQNGAMSMVPGTRVRVETQQPDGSTLVQQQLVGSSTARSTSMTAAYFGLGKASEATVTVTYPNDLQFTHRITETDRLVQLVNQATPIGEPLVNQPNTTRILPNYPNPFNPQTTLRFQLERAQTVSLMIYNTIGQRVATLADRRFAAGNHQIPFRAESLPSGVYFAVLKTEQNQFTQKLLLLK